MGAIFSREQKLTMNQLRAYQAETGLSYEQLQKLHIRFRALDRSQNGYLRPADLLRIPQLVQNPLHRQIVDGFFPQGCECLDFQKFMRTCSIFMVPQFAPSVQISSDRRMLKLQLLCKMLDTKRRGYITRCTFQQVMRTLLENFVVQDISGDGSSSQSSVEQELQQLEESAFANSESVSYELFIQRLENTNIEDRLSINKWLSNEPKDKSSPPL